MRAQRKPWAVPPVIEGEAVVIERRPGSRAENRAGADAPFNDNRRRRPAADPASVAAARPRADLLFPDRAAMAPGRPVPAPAIHARPGSARRLGTTIACGVAVVLAGLAAVALRAPAAVELADVRTAFAERNGGRVLTVEGRIRNGTAAPVTGPAITVRAATATALLRRSFVPATGTIPPGAAVDFRSTLAVPSATGGPVGVVLER